MSDPIISCVQFAVCLTGGAYSEGHVGTLESTHFVSFAQGLLYIQLLPMHAWRDVAQHMCCGPLRVLVTFALSQVTREGCDLSGKCLSTEAKIHRCATLHFKELASLHRYYSLDSIVSEPLQAKIEEHILHMPTELVIGGEGGGAESFVVTFQEPGGIVAGTKSPGLGPRSAHQQGSPGAQHTNIFRITRMNPHIQHHLGALTVDKLESVHVAIARHDVVDRVELGDSTALHVSAVASPRADLWSLPTASRCSDYVSMLVEWQCDAELELQVPTHVGERGAAVLKEMLAASAFRSLSGEDRESLGPGCDFRAAPMCILGGMGLSSPRASLGQTELGPTRYHHPQHRVASS